MSIVFATSAREVLEQVVREPRFREITTIPLFAPITIALIVGAYALFGLSSYLYLQGYIHWAAMMALNGVAVYAAFTPLHDATHRAVSSSRRLNDLLGTIACFALLPGITTRIYRYLHLEHHRFAGEKGKDPDELFVSGHPLALLFVLPGVDVHWSLWYLFHWSSRPVSERVEFTAGIVFYVGWHTAWLLSPFAWEFFLLWMIPQRIGIFLVTYFFAHIQHPEDILWETAPFQCTVHIKGGLLKHWMFLGQTHHHIHHLLPSVPFYRYYDAWQAAKYLLQQQNIPKRGVFGSIDKVVLPDYSGAHWTNARITAVRDVAEGVREFEIRPLDGETLPAFTAGSHIDVEIADNLVRQYSLCGSPRDRERYLIAVKKEPDGDGGSRTLHDTFDAEKTLRISAPRNNFPLRDGIRDYILVSGGIGITPILAMAHELHSRGAEFQLHVCARSRASLPFADSLEQLPFAERIKVHLDDGDDAQHFAPASDLGAWKVGRELYICGPTAFMKWVQDTLLQTSWPNRSIFSETFVAPRLAPKENKPFEVELARSGKVLQVAPDQFLLDVLNDNGCGVICSCTQGICGSCITPVLAGEPEHRDAILSDAERLANDKMCVCVGRAKSPRLVLDL
jgi:vanillate O-demethylase ferredoxin subunit